MTQNSTLQETLIYGPVITAAELLEHWKGHRRLTRKLIEAMPEDQFAVFSIGGMRPLAQLVQELLDLGAPGMLGLVTDDWKAVGEMGHAVGKPAITGKAAALKAWDEQTRQITDLWPQVTPQRWHETTMAFGAYEGTVISTIFYLIDNEVHHRSQGYVYLRALGIEPPAFWDRN